MKKYLAFSIMCLISTLCNSQTKFTDFEKKAFVEVYMLNKNQNSVNKNHSNNATIYNHQITKSRYQEILKTSLRGELLDLSNSEKDLIQDIKEQNKIIETRKRLSAEQACINKNLSYDRYCQLLASFRSEIKMHNELKPFFQKYIQEHGK